MLLQVITSPTAIVACVLSAISLLLGVVSLVRKEQREDGQTVSQRLKKLEVVVANHDAQRQSEAQAREKLADTLFTKVETLEKEFSRRFTSLEANAVEVQRIKETISAVQAKLERLEAIENKLDRLTDMLTRKVA